MSTILMLCKGFPPQVKGGGVESFSEQIARAYLRSGADVVVITQTTGPAGWQHRRYPDGMIRVFNTGTGGQLITAVKMLKIAVPLSRTTHFDLIHATTWRPSITWLVGVRQRPLVITIHGREIFIVPWWLRPVMWIALRAADQVFAVSGSTRDRAQARLPRRVGASDWSVAANGLSYIDDDDKKSGVDKLGSGGTDRKLRILTLARLIDRKNIHGCIEALASLHKSGYNNFEYRIAGTGPLAARLQRQVEENDLAEFVTFLGYVDDEQVPGLYAWADVFLHPQVDMDGGTDFEGFGLSIADAMSFGCLAIAGSGSGPTDFIQHGVTGILVDGTNNAELSRAIRLVLDEPAPFRRIADDGRAYVRAELSWDKHASAVLAHVATTIATEGETKSHSKGIAQ